MVAGGFMLLRAAVALVLLFCAVLMMAASPTAGAAGSTNNPYHHVGSRASSAPLQQQRVATPDRRRGGRRTAASDFEANLRELLAAMFRGSDLSTDDGVVGVARALRDSIAAEDFSLPHPAWAIAMGPPENPTPVPVLRLIFQLHRHDPASEDVRAALLLLLRAGVDANAETAATAPEPPIMFTALLSPSETRCVTRADFTGRAIMGPHRIACIAKASHGCETCAVM
jgi:hypothetical protein